MFVRVSNVWFNWIYHDGHKQNLLIKLVLMLFKYLLYDFIFIFHSVKIIILFSELRIEKHTSESIEWLVPSVNSKVESLVNFLSQMFALIRLYYIIFYIIINRIDIKCVHKVLRELQECVLKNSIKCDTLNHCSPGTKSTVKAHIIFTYKRVYFFTKKTCKDTLKKVKQQKSLFLPAMHLWNAMKWNQIKWIIIY